MFSATTRRNSCRGIACGTRASSDLSGRRRSSVCGAHLSGAGTGSGGGTGAQGEDLSVRLSQPIVTITLRFLLAIDLWLTKRLGVCACEKSACSGVRPLVRLVEVSGHAIPWLLGTVYSLLRGETVEEQEVMLNLTLALLLDLLLVRLVKTLVRRPLPAQNRSDLLSAFFMERFSFPSGHAARAAMCARFFLARLVDTTAMRVLVVGWAALVSLSRLLLARHYATDVLFGLAMGYCEYGLMERIWVTWDVLLLRLQETLGWAYAQLWAADWTF